MITIPGIYTYTIAEWDFDFLVTSCSPNEGFSYVLIKIRSMYNSNIASTGIIANGSHIAYVATLTTEVHDINEYLSQYPELLI